MFRTSFVNRKASSSDIPDSNTNHDPVKWRTVLVVLCFLVFTAVLTLGLLSMDLASANKFHSSATDAYTSVTSKTSSSSLHHRHLSEQDFVFLKGTEPGSYQYDWSQWLGLDRI